MCDVGDDCMLCNDYSCVYKSIQMYSDYSDLPGDAGATADDGHTLKYLIKSGMI